jgi:kynureninase
MERILQKQFLLTGYLEHLLKKYFNSANMIVVTPDDPDQRGCQLSLVFSMDLHKVHSKLEAHGVVVVLSYSMSIFAASDS